MNTLTPTPNPDPPAPAGLEAARREAAATERQRLAQTLHDTVAQSLTAVYFIAKQIELQLVTDSPELSGKIASLGNMIRQVSGELQACIRGLESAGPPP